MTDLLAMTEYTVPLGIVLVFLVAAWIARVRRYNPYELIDLHRRIRKEQERNALFKQKREERRNREL